MTAESESLEVINMRHHVALNGLLGLGSMALAVACGYDAGSVDGYYGPQTSQAVGRALEAGAFK